MTVGSEALMKCTVANRFVIWRHPALSSIYFFILNVGMKQNNDRVGRVQWVRAGLALGYSHPNITGFPR